MNVINQSVNTYYLQREPGSCCSNYRAVIPNQGCESGHLGTRKKLSNGGKRHTHIVLGYLFTVTTHKFETTATILITKVLLI